MTNYLERYDAAPEAEKYPLARGWIDHEALPFFKELRDKRPVLVTPQCTLIARYDDVIEALNMPKVFTVSLYVRTMSDVYLMSHDDDALHYREKSLMQSLLNRDDVPKVRVLVAKIAKGLLDAANGSLEAIGGYTRMVPATLVRDYFGLTGAPLTQLMDWSYWNQVDSFYNQPFDLVPQAERDNIAANHARVTKEMTLYMAGLMARRLLWAKLTGIGSTVAGWFGGNSDTLTDDIVARMLRSSFPKEMEFDLKRVAVNAGGLLIGTVETTQQATAQVIQFLLARPQLLAQAKTAAAASDPVAFDGIVWEALRFVPISPYMFRHMGSDYTIGKGTDYATTIAKGTNVLTLTQSAMFDERAYERPDEFLPGRNWYNHFVFGYGSHECLGKYIGMVLIPEMVRQIVLRPDLRQLGPIDYKGQHLPQEYKLAWKA